MLNLQNEWAVCKPDEKNGWVHKYELGITNLKILDFQQYNVLAWLAELMKHREAAGTNRYRILAKEFVRDNIDIEILEELLSLGGLGIQYCIKSELAYSKLEEIDAEL